MQAADACAKLALNSVPKSPYIPCQSVQNTACDDKGGDCTKLGPYRWKPYEDKKEGSIRELYAFVIGCLERQEVGLWTSGVSRCGFRRRAG